MKTIFVAIFALLFSITLTSCVVTVSPGDTQDQGIYGYVYYYFPEYNFYYNPALNQFWWYQWGSWQYGPQLPPWYVIDPDAYYLTITSRSINPTRYTNYYQTQYQRGYYRNRIQQIRQAPEGRFPFYRPSRQPGQMNPRNERNPNYNNNGERKAIPSRIPETRPSQPNGPVQQPYNEGTRRNENRNVNPIPQNQTDHRMLFQNNQNQPENKENKNPERFNSLEQNRQKTVTKPTRSEKEAIRHEKNDNRQRNEHLRQENVQEKQNQQTPQKDNQQR